MEKQELALGPITLLGVFEGTNHKKFELPDYVQTRSDLEQLLVEHGINYAKKDFTLSPGKLGLNDADSQIVRPEAKMMEYNGQMRPVSVLGLFLTAKKSDSGTLTDSEVRVTVKELCAANMAAKEFFCQGKHWTNKPTAALRELLTQWEKTGTKVAKKPIEAKGMTVLPTEKKVKVHTPKTEELNTEEQVLVAMAEVTKDVNDVISVAVQRMTDIVNSNPKDIAANTNDFSDRERIFEMFQSIGESLTDGYASIGNCLVLCKNYRDQQAAQTSKIVESVKQHKAQAQKVSEKSVDDLFAAMSEEARYYKRK